jgi:hypothetical protein
MITYTKQQLESIISLLNTLETRGIENAKRVALISQILDDGEVAKEGE